MRIKQNNFLISSIRTLLLVAFAGSCGCQELLHNQNLIFVTDSSQRPYLEEAYRNKNNGLLRAIDQSLAWFETPTSKSSYSQPFALLTHKQAKQSLVTFRNILLQSADTETFANRILSEFNTYKSVGNDGRGIAEIARPVG